MVSYASGTRYDLTRSDYFWPRDETLLHAIESLLPRLLRPDGSLLLKLLESPEAQASVQRLRVRFQHARSVKTAATRGARSVTSWPAATVKRPIDSG